MVDDLCDNYHRKRRKARIVDNEKMPQRCRIGYKKHEIFIHSSQTVFPAQHATATVAASYGSFALAAKANDVAIDCGRLCQWKVSFRIPYEGRDAWCGVWADIYAALLLSTDVRIV
jgi:hypothetical protein